MNATSPRGPNRGRIVMLVDNGVEGDSRVQKQAESAAAAGWEVFLLGCSPTGKLRKWTIGGAKVRLLPFATGPDRRRHEVRSTRLRDPLAYPHGPRRAHRERQVRVRRAELRLARARLAARADRLPAPLLLARKAALRLRRKALDAAAAWVAFRAARTDRLHERRQAMTAPLDRLTTRLWRLVLPPGRLWRRFEPALWDLELAFAPMIDKLGPDLIHANDFRMLGVGARAALRARAKGRGTKLVWDAHEYLPGMHPWITHPRWHVAQMAHEREYAPCADAVVTVSEPLAGLLQERHRLPETPTVVMNAPEMRPLDADDAVPSLRERCGIGRDTPLLVYSGGAAERRGLNDVVTALQALPGVHLALIVRSHRTRYMVELARLTERLGVADRVHHLPYVPHRHVVPHLSEADVGLIPLHHYVNHEIALITKFFEYSHARLPIVVSDVEAMGEKVAATRQGEVFKAGDVESLVQAVKAVLTASDTYRAAYDDAELLAEWTWAAQAEKLHGVYRRLLDDRPER
ncbi:MAG TPA: glycosyltransferase family 4 protein [Glycomyces sp.]|nr:glycosyltransferase family 4 protein [Glycomyces sp.]